MRITIACKYFSPRGGAQSFLLGFVRHLADQGHLVKVLTMEVKGELAGVDVQIVSLPPVPKTFRDVLFARAARDALAHDECDVSFGEQKTWGADVVRPGGGVHLEYMAQIVKSYPSASMRALASVAKRLSLKERLNHYIERKLYKAPGPRCVIANSDLVRRHLVKRYPHLDGRVTVVYNGADCRKFSPELRSHRARVRGELRIPDDAILGAFVSFDLRRKGLPTVLRSLSILKRKTVRRDAYVVVVGKKKGWAQRMARRLGVEGRVRFVGLQAPDCYYGASDLLVLPSYFDPCANVTLEGLACGLPALTSVHNGAHELLTPGRDGFYVRDPSDAAQLAGFMEYFMDPRKLAQASEAARSLALKHTARDMHEQIMEAIMPLVERKLRERRPC